MDEVRLLSRSAEETEQIAGAVADRLRPGDVVLLRGDVGTGKTTFVRGACAALGVGETVTSPSFTIGRRYTGKVPVAHVDLYRLDSLEGEDPALLHDYLADDTISFVEWPEVAGGPLAPGEPALTVELAHAGGDRRSLRATGVPRLLGRMAEASVAGA